MGFDGERFHGWTKEAHESYPTRSGTARSAKLRLEGPLNKSATGSWSTPRAQARQCVRVNKTVDPEMRVAEMIRQEQWLPRIPPPG